MDLVKLITQKVEEVESSGKLEEIVEKHVLSCLEDVVRDSFQWSGSAKKSIEEALKDKLNINPENLNLSRYQKIVTSIVEEHVNNTIVKNLGDEIRTAVDKITEPIEKKEWKLSEIIDEFTESIDKSYDGDMEDQYGECTLIAETSRSFTRIYFDMGTDVDKYRCKNKIHVHEGKIFHAELDGKIFSPFSIYSMDNFESFIFKLYCNNVQLVIDEDECELNYHREDCD